MPRFATVIPVALATMACSKEILVPSAKLVTMYGVLTPALGEAALGCRGAVGVLQALDVPADQWPQTDAPDEAREVQLDPRLVAVAAGEDHPVSLCSPAQDRADRAVHLGVEQHDVLAVVDGGSDHVAAVLDRTRGFHDDVDLVGLDDRPVVLGDRRARRR